MAYGAVWVVAGLCSFQVVRMDQATLAVTMRIPIPRNFSAYLVADDGAFWLSSSNSARFSRLNPHTGRFSTVLLPEMAPDSQVVGFASDPKSGLLYISVINQDAAQSQATSASTPRPVPSSSSLRHRSNSPACSALPEASSGSFKAGA